MDYDVLQSIGYEQGNYALEMSNRRQGAILHNWRGLGLVCRLHNSYLMGVCTELLSTPGPYYG